MPNGLASAEETTAPTNVAAVQQTDTTNTTTAEAKPMEARMEPTSVSADEVCLTGEAAEKFSEDEWLFEAERENLRQENIKLRAWEAELNAQTAELRDLQSTIEARWNEMQLQADEDIVHLAKMYGSMKADQAAEIFDQMDPDFAAGFLLQLPSEQAGLILASMENRKAYIVSVSMAASNADLRAD